MREEISERLFKFSVDTIGLSRRLSADRFAVDVFRQLMRSSTSVGANWEEAVAGLSKSDFTHSANIARKEARESHYWLKLAAECFPVFQKEGIDPLIKECNEIISILTTVVKKQQTGAVKNIISVLLFSSFILHPSFFLCAADWPTFRGNWARTGYVSEQADPPLVQEWAFQAEGGIVSSPAVFEDVIYFGTRGNWLYALNARTGALLWRVQTGGWVDAAPSVFSGTVYAPSRDGYLYALDRLTGALLWRATLGASSVSSPLVRGGRVFVGTGSPEKKLKVFDAASGAQLGEYPAGQPVESAPAAYGGNVYFGSNDGRIYALDRDTLLPPPLWSLSQTKGSFGLNAIGVSSGVLYALPGCDEKRVLTLDTVTGSETGQGHSSPVEASDSWLNVTSPVLGPGTLYFSGGAAANKLFALDRETLSPVWASSPSLGGLSSINILSAPAMAGNALYAGTNNGQLVYVSSLGVAGASMPLSSAAYSSPAISNGMVFAGNMGGGMFGFRALNAAAISSPKEEDIVSGLVQVRGYVANPGLSGYELHYGEGVSPSSWTFISSAAVAGGATQVDNAGVGQWDTSLLGNGVYTLKLSAVPGSGGAALLALRVNRPPPPPSDFTAADAPGDSGNRIQLSWTASSGTPGAYRIYRDGGSGPALLGSVSSATLAYIDNAAVTGATYTYLARTFDGYSESENAGPVSAFSVNNMNDATPPSAITDLSAESGPAAGRVRLTWTAPGNDGMLGRAAYYIIRASSESSWDWTDFDSPLLHGSTVPVEGPAGDNMSAEVKGLLGGVTYYFAVKTADFIPTTSPISNIATSYAEIDLVPPLPPAALSVADTLADHGGSLTLSWSASPDDGAGAGDVYGYKVYRRSGAGAQTQLASVTSGTTGYTDAAAPENLRFCYSVAAFDSTNNSPLSGEACGVSANNWRWFDAEQGGVVRLEDGAVVDIPGNAISGTVGADILVTKLDPVSYLPQFTVRANTGARPTGVVYEVKFENPATKLVKNASLSLPYADADVTGMAPENLRMYTLSGGTWLLLNTSKSYPALHKVTAEVSHFSFFRIMEYVPGGALTGADEVYTYPNPAVGEALTFKFLLSDKARVKIRVYNVAGEKVAVLEKADCPAGVTSEIRWDIRNIASGVYIYKLEASGSSGSKTITKKLAIVR